MDPGFLVDDKIEEGEMLIRQLRRDGFDVTAAFWVKIFAEGNWRLFIASPSFDPGKANLANRIVYAALDKVPKCTIGPLDITLLESTGPIARDAILLRDRFPIREPKRFHGRLLNVLATEEVLIYPQALPWEIRELPGGHWQVQVHEPDDLWLTCDSKEDAQRIAKAPVLYSHAVGRVEANEPFAIELETTANAMAKYRLGFGSRFLKRRAEEIRQ